MPAVTTTPKTRFARIVVEAMNEKNISLSDFAMLTADKKKFRRHISYELLRKIITGVAHPSEWIMESICKILGLDEKEMERVATEDRIKAKYGSTVRQIVGTDPTLAPFETVIPALTPKQRESFLAQMQAVAKLNH